MEEIFSKFQMIAREYLRAIRESIQKKESEESKILSDEFAQFLIDSAQAYAAAANELRSLAKELPESKKESMLMASYLKEMSGKCLRDYKSWTEFQKKGDLFSHLGDFSELERIANQND